MMSAPLPDWIAAVMRACRSLALIVSSVTSIFICLLYSAINRLSSASPSGMKSTHCRRWSFVAWARAGATPPPAARSPSAPDVLRKLRREIVVMCRLPAAAAIDWTDAGCRESLPFALHCQAAFEYLRRTGRGPGRERMGSLTGSELLARSLTSQGMDTLFFLMGGPMLDTESACIKLGVRAIDTRHEQAAAMMAHAYARVTRRPGVCM